MSKQWQKSLRQRQHNIRQASLWRSRRELGSAQSPDITMSGDALLNFSSNDYLGLANHPTLISNAQRALGEWGVGSGASHLVCGHQTPHHQLEQALATYVGAERAVLFSTGYMANLAVATALTSKHDLILQDKLNHASLIDGARLSDAQFKRYAHANVEHASTLLQGAEFENALIMTDGVFSMDGDIAPLTDLKALADEHQALLFVDDAHGLACMGQNGLGALALSGLRPNDNVLLMGTLGKAFGSFGAFVAGDSLYIEQLIQSARSYIYTTALPPAVAATSCAAIALLEQSGTGLRQRLQVNITYFKARVSALGLTLMPSSSAIQPLMLGDEERALALSASLYEQGFLVTAIRPPTVPKGSARLRFTLSASHTSEQIDLLINALARAIECL